MIIIKRKHKRKCVDFQYRLSFSLFFAETRLRKYAGAKGLIGKLTQMILSKVIWTSGISG